MIANNKIKLYAINETDFKRLYRRACMLLMKQILNAFTAGL